MKCPGLEGKGRHPRYLSDEAVKHVSSQGVQARI